MSLDDIATTLAADIEVSKRTSYCDNLFNWGNYNFHGLKTDTAQIDFGMNPINFGQPGYDIAALVKAGVKMTTVTVYEFPGGGAFAPEFPSGSKVQIPMGMVPSTGSDHQLTLILPNGDVLNCWQWQYSPFGGGVVFAASVEHIPAGDKGNSHTICPAVPMNWGVLTHEDFIAGKLKCLAISVSGRCSMGGPLPPLDVHGYSTITDPTDPLIGTKYGCASAPARFLESVKQRTDLTIAVPDGSRFPVAISAVDKAAKLKSLPPKLQPLAEYIYDCLTLCGLMTVETTGMDGPCFVLADTSPRAINLWKGEGVVVNSGAQIMSGIITRPRLSLLVAPTITRADGSKTKCATSGVSVGYP